MKKAIIIGASSIGDSSFLLQKDSSSLFVACDGGYKHFLNNNIEPDILVGDFDTFDETKIRNPKKIIKLNPIKDDTDTFFIVKYLLEQGYQEFHFYGCYGKKLDHTLANIQILSYLKDKSAAGYLYSEDNKDVVFMLDGGEKITFFEHMNGRLSVFSYSESCEGVNESNLKYTLKDASLNHSVAIGISNEFIDSDKEPIISVVKGRLLLLVPSSSIKKIN